ncbi:unnamed protein product [Acanthosepion pharaonis]|uniref:Uncharacterized protein n=1 Tax=Acanthosepion pharaonis TaxID=158019 RepID=A0A812DC56_ACAPH|nr:unnamed protein product [Sepia pharaonis]
MHICSHQVLQTSCNLQYLSTRWARNSWMVFLQPVYVVSWMRSDKNFWVIQALLSNAFSPQVFITVFGFWIPAHLSYLFKEATESPLQPTSNDTRVQLSPFSQTSITSFSHQSSFLSRTSSIPTSHATVISPSNICFFSPSINTPGLASFQTQ